MATAAKMLNPIYVLEKEDEQIKNNLNSKSGNFYLALGIISAVLSFLIGKNCTLH